MIRTTISRNILHVALFLCLFVKGEAAEIKSKSVSNEQLFPRIELVTIKSHVLNREKSYCVILPESYNKTEQAESNKKWPVLFLLHGRGRTERSLVDDVEARNKLLKSPFVIVLPDGDDGWYIDSPVRKKDRYETYLQEVITHATSAFSLSEKREQRGLCGWSMGGYGAMHFAEQHANEFGAVATIIGLLDFPSNGITTGRSYVVPVDRFGTDEKTWNEFNPILKAERLRSSAVFLVIAKTAFDRRMNENFSNRLNELKIPHRTLLLEGGHTFEVVKESLDPVIEFMHEKLVGKAIRLNE